MRTVAAESLDGVWVWPLDSTTPASAKVAEVATASFGQHRTAPAYCMAMAAFVAVGSQ